MKITFLTPPSINGRAPERLFGCNLGYFFQTNIFVLYPSAVLEKEGYSVEVIDCPVEGIGEKELKKILEHDISDVYVFYTVFLSEKTDQYWAEKIRELKRRCTVIFMGPEPTSRPKDFIKNEKDFVIRGEPEETIKELIDSLNSDYPYYRPNPQNLKKIKGISWMGNNMHVNNPPREPIKDLDDLIFPARHLIVRDKYYNPKLKGRPSTVMLTSRGCFGKCIYCIPCSLSFATEIEHKKHFGNKPAVRLRSPQNIYEEFKNLKEDGYKSVAIIDDNFMGLPGGDERIIKICKLIEPLKMEWGCLARVDQLQNEYTLEWMKKAGCVYIDIGVESFEQKVLNYVKKGVTVGQVFHAILLMKHIGIEPKVNILLGSSPLETEESFKWTVNVLKMLNIDWVSFSVVIPHPGTDFYKIVKLLGWFATKSKDFEPVDPYQQATVNFPNMSHEELHKWVRWCYKEYYMRPQYFWKRLSKIRSWREFKEVVKIAWRLFHG